MKITFGAFVREKRLDKNIGLNNFAKMVGVSAPFISKMEVGNWNSPSETTIIKIAEILEMDKDYLLALAGKISTENKEKLLKEILEKNKPVKVFTKEQKCAFGKLQSCIEKIQCSFYFQCPFNFFGNGMNANLRLFNLLTIENVDIDYILSRLNAAEEQLMNYDKQIKTDDETFPFTELRTVYRTPLSGYDIVPENMLYKKKDVVKYGLRDISDARQAINIILEKHQ